MTDLELLIQDKYEGDASKVTNEDKKRLASGEPLAYVIGWVPFLGLRIDLSSKPLIPRPETEWWTEKLIAHVREKHGDSPFTLLDLCAGSGAIGLAILSSFPNAHVSFGERIPEHTEQIRKNIELNDLDSSRAEICISDVFTEFGEEKWDYIATNPPYIPSTRNLENSVIGFEPSEALFAGADGLDIISCIAGETRLHIEDDGELWIECDIQNAEATQKLLVRDGAKKVALHKDLYGRARLVIALY